MFDQEADSALLAEEFDLLRAFGLKQFSNDEPYSIESTHLLDDSVCLGILDEILPKLGAPDLRVTASLVMKRIAFLTLAPSLYAMSGFNKGLNLSIENSVFEYPLKNKLWVSKMPLKDIAAVCWLTHQQSRDAWRENILQKEFAGHLTLLVEQFYRLTKVSRRILWENVAVRVFSIYEQRILPNIEEGKRATAEADYAYLLDKTTTQVFGLKDNPLAVFYREKRQTSWTDSPIRVRRTCCFYYQATEPPEYCNTCPLLFKKTKGFS